MSDCNVTMKRSAEADLPPPKKTRSSAKKASDKDRGKTRVNIGLAFPRWRALRAAKGLQTDSELAFLLLDDYEKGPWASKLSKTTRFGVLPPELSNIDEVSASDREEQFHEEAVEQLVQDVDETTLDAPEVQGLLDSFDEGEMDLDKDQVNTLENCVSSEFIIDEECILQLFKLCRECNRQCTVRKNVQGLKLVVSQACCFCHSHRKWTNLPSDDEDDGHF